MKNKPFYTIISICFIFCISDHLFAEDNPATSLLAPLVKNISVDMLKSDFHNYYPMKSARTYRIENNKTWISYDYYKNNKTHDIITFYFLDNKLANWELNNRAEITHEYVSEFVSGTIIGVHPKIFKAIKNVLNKLPKDAFTTLTDRNRPVIFLDYYTKGIARYAGSLEYLVRDEDPHSFTSLFA